MNQYKFPPMATFLRKRKRRLMPLECLAVYLSNELFSSVHRNRQRPSVKFYCAKKGTDQNLTCNRFSEFVPIQWLKVNLSLLSVLFYLIIS